MDPKWTLCLGVILLSTTAFGPAAGSREWHYDSHERHYDDEPCPKGWNDNGYICWKELNEKEDFRGALRGCLRKSKLDEFHAELMPVRFLRDLKNPYPYHDQVDRRPNHKLRGVYRVNGIFDRERTWVNIPSGKEVKFSHYEQPNGKEGYTLVWDTFANELRLEDRYDHHKVLCYTERKNECRKCHRDHQQEECNTNGNCYQGTCYCDQGFKGEFCSVPETSSSNKELFVFGGVGQQRDQKYKFREDTVCNTKATFEPDVDSFAGFDYVFSDIWACGGLKSMQSGLSSCYKFNRYEQNWTLESSLPYRVAHGASAPLRIKSYDDDRLWWIPFGREFPTAGSGETGSVVGTTVVKTWYDQEGFKDLDDSPRLNDWYGREMHCVVQINDCEMAILGGSNPDSGYREDWIIIYNFEENKWRWGPRLLNERNNPSCGVIIDQMTHHRTVVIACGGTDEVTEYWDLETWEIRADEDHACPTGVENFDKAQTLNEWELVMTNGLPDSSATDGIWTFSIGEGFDRIAEWTVTDRAMAGAVIVPKGMVFCDD